MLTADLDGDILVLTLDDGARNALLPETFDALVEALEGADPATSAIVITGRPGVLTAGLDLKWMKQADRAAIRDLLTRFGRAMMALWTQPRPTVLAATGHCLAAGSMISMACDHAVAAEGEYAWGLVETQIDFPMPLYGLALARANLRNDLLEDLLLPGRRIGPAEAVEAGFADELAAEDDVFDRAMAVAAELAELPAHSYGETKQRLRGDAAQAVLAGLTDDVADLTSHLPEGAHGQ